MANKISILAIDDHLPVLTAIRRSLTDEGYRVFTAKSGLKGLGILSKKRIDIVLLDHFMPEMDGFETLERIKRQFPGVKVIFLSGHAGEEALTLAIELNVSDFVPKPISLTKLLKSIRWVSGREQEKVVSVTPGQKISVPFYEAICIYPERAKALPHLKMFASERFFKIIIATTWIDVLAVPSFVTLIDPSAVRKGEWSTLFDYLNDVSETQERFVLLSKAYQPKIPSKLKKCFRTIANEKDLDEYILQRSKVALRRMTTMQRSAFVSKRVKDARMIAERKGLEKRFLTHYLAKYYNVSFSTIKRDSLSIKRSGG